MLTWRDHQARADAALFARHGDAAVYTPLSGDPVSLTVLVSEDYELRDAQGDVSEYVTVIRYRLAELSDHDIGATLVANGKTYSLGKSIDNDGFMRTVQVFQ